MRGRRQVWPPNSMPEGPRASGGRNPPPCRPRGGSGLTKTECVLTPLSCRRRYLLLYCAAGPLIFGRSWIIRRPRGRTQPRVLARIGDGARWSWKDLIALSELEITPLQPRTRSTHFFQAEKTSLEYWHPVSMKYIVAHDVTLAMTSLLPHKPGTKAESKKRRR